MIRRTFLAALPLLMFAPGLAAHSPYRQWMIYRQRHLLIFAARTDPTADRLSEDVAKVLLEHLPTSQAEAARAPHEQRIASLITTDQADVALLARESALALTQGRGEFAYFGPSQLRVLVENASHQLLCRENFPKAHAFLLAQVLVEQGTAMGFTVPDRPALQEDAVSAHEGALAYLRGETLE